MKLSSVRVFGLQYIAAQSRAVPALNVAGKPVATLLWVLTDARSRSRAKKILKTVLFCKQYPSIGRLHDGEL
jgi:hypothetical protein